MLQWIVLTSLSNSRAMDRDIEFAPSLFADLEGWLVEGYFTCPLVLLYACLWREGRTLLWLRKGRMQLIHDLLEDGRWDLLALLV